MVILYTFFGFVCIIKKVVNVKKIVNCKLKIKRVIDKKEETSVIEGKGYYSDKNGEIIVFFSGDGVNYKYIWNKGIVTILCNDSCYKFEVNVKREGIIKSDDYSLEIITLASKIELSNNCIIVNYSLYQQKSLIGHYYSELSFS